MRRTGRSATMNGTHAPSSGGRDRALAEAIGRREIVVLTLRNSGVWLSRKSQFIGMDPPYERVLVACPAFEDGRTGLPSPTPGDCLGVAFRRGHKKCVFSSVVLARGSGRLRSGQLVESLALRWPERIEELQRRVFYRAPVPGNQRIPVTLWHGGATNRPAAGTDERCTYTGMLHDLSAGGLSMIVSKDQDPRSDGGDAVGLCFQPDPDGLSFVLDGLLRRATEMPDGTLILGIQFVGLDATEEGRQTLHSLVRIVTRYQRYELQQARLSR